MILNVFVTLEIIIRIYFSLERRKMSLMDKNFMI